MCMYPSHSLGFSSMIIAYMGHNVFKPFFMLRARARLSMQCTFMSCALMLKLSVSFSRRIRIVNMHLAYN